VGDKEMAAGQVAVRTRSGEDIGQMSIADFVARLRKEVLARGATA
jgi:threonyl-tRNA synthetase